MTAPDIEAIAAEIISDNLCVCGCQRPRRPRSKYYSDKCCQAVARRRNKQYYWENHNFIKCAEPNCCKPRWSTGAFCQEHGEHGLPHKSKEAIERYHNRAHTAYQHTNPSQKGVTVKYIGAALEDHVSRTMAESWLKAGQLQAGDVVIFPDRIITVGAILEMEAA